LREQRKNFIILIAACVIFLCLACGVVEKLNNRSPVIHKVSCDADSMIVIIGDTVKVSAEATDPDRDELTYSWDATGGHFVSSLGQTVLWIAPDREGDFDIELTVRDRNEGVAREKITITVISGERPTVVIASPKDGDCFVALDAVEIQVQVSPARFIEKVDFYINDSYLATDASPPFHINWPLTGLKGEYEIKASAFRKIPVPVTAQDSVHVTIEGIIPIPRNIHGSNRR